MVNHVVPVAELGDRTLRMATKIAGKGRFALKLIKESVNAMEDVQGRQHAMSISFALHQLAHTHNLAVHGLLYDPSVLPPESARAVTGGGT
jgi:enoyl-CoA hydratase